MISRRTIFSALGLAIFIPKRVQAHLEHEPDHRWTWLHRDDVGNGVIETTYIHLGKRVTETVTFTMSDL